MLLLLISCLSSFILFYIKSLVTLANMWLSKEVLRGGCIARGVIPLEAESETKSTNPMKKPLLSSEHSLVVENEQCMSLLDLPDLALECILERLPPRGLSSMGGVCRSLRETCTSDHLWEKHMKRKWGGVIGHAALQQWQSQSYPVVEASKEKACLMSRFLYGARALPFPWLKLKLNNPPCIQNCPPTRSIMSWYLALEAGKLWFPGQVYNREHGHVGFLLSCYDAELSYDPLTNTFRARYPPHGKRPVAFENSIPWERVRAHPMNTSPEPHHLHISNCLNNLRPGDHIEIQWRRHKDFPYGWWYGVVGHLESCDGDENFCGCHKNDTIVLEFNQYSPGSRWRLAYMNRRSHGEEGNEADGFYGGIRKICSNDEISAWKQLWPAQFLE
ncbi:F-box domain [Dillenia turbinata]|uniref:F-box domain n=1 Tax=Dillenia turbinata TaxID=194707 RepID=A0AAN8V2Q6_9MAGN